MTTDPFLDLDGRTVVVTGAGQGVGRGLALALAERGAGGVAVNDIDPARAEEVAAEVAAIGVPAFAAPFDVCDFHAVGEAIGKIGAELGPVGVLVNNAGNQGARADRPPPLPFWEQGPDDWAPSLTVNLDGVLNCTRHALTQMIEATYGRVITVISDAGRVGEGNGLEAYSAAKAGAAGITRAVARVAGRYGVTANCVALGATRTPATAHLTDDDTVVRKVLSTYLVRRFGEPEDAARVVAFLAAGSADWITGQTIPVNGGYSLTL